ncbi:translation initiation factor IF-5A [Candidatus Woesearchaeota archaeon]|nr:translation initiation factor IF-5A [Candidatus Woesearchaeota archaeon]
MDIKQVQASSIKEGNYVVFDGIACIVKSIQKSKTGKHGSSKCRMEAISIIDSRKIIKIVPGSDNLEVPIIEKKSAQVLSVHGDIANIMDTETFETFDIKIPEDLKDNVVEGIQVVYWTILGEKIIKQVK